MRTLRCGSIAAIISLVTACSGGGPEQAGLLPAKQLRDRSREAPVACRDLRSMRELNRDLRVVKNPRTGDSLEYAVVGEGAKRDEVLVFFPGTGQTIADWPMQMITNSKYSPNIVRAIGYRAGEDATVSLCHEYRLVFFDYPGVGVTPYRATATHDAVASDVDAMLQRVGQRFGIATDTVDPVGWSLGTAFSLKYAFLSPVSRPQRNIHDLFLIAAGPGGSEQAQVDADNAACVTSLFDAAETATGSLGNEIKGNLTKLLFPYKGQTPKENGTNSNCTATISSQSVTLNVTPDCTIVNGCKGFTDLGFLGLETYPWKRSKGVSGSTYILQRHQDNDFDVAYCAKAGTGFRSEDCTAYGPIEQSIADGGVCRTDTSNPDRPVSSNCVRLNVTGNVMLYDGFEDIFTQWTYDRALERGLNAVRPGIAQLQLYPGGANHGLMMQHPRWVQTNIQKALAR
ncbi:MAG TPA: alpha/beta hydrolase [Candidatus Acidoferrales bacterium]|jgi:hypothetical protein|nr:alpha/beta hydrolase [Candidatus Acidoferrales bacterium]